MGTAPTLLQSILGVILLGVILGDMFNYLINIIQLLQSGGSSRAVGRTRFRVLGLDLRGLTVMG